MFSEHRSEGFGVDDNISQTIETSRSDMIRTSPTVAVKEVLEQAAAETQSVGQLMHHSKNVLLVLQHISGGSHLVSVDGSLTHERSSGSTGELTGGCTSNPCTTGVIVSNDDIDVIGRNTVSQN